MSCCAGRFQSAARPFDLEEAERLLLRVYTALPLLPAAEDGSRSAALARVGGSRCA
jgi:hypothetical protein